jgi:hypothetical protein
MIALSKVPGDAGAGSARKVGMCSSQMTASFQSRRAVGTAIVGGVGAGDNRIQNIAVVSRDRASIGVDAIGIATGIGGIALVNFVALAGPCAGDIDGPVVAIAVPGHRGDERLPVVELAHDRHRVGEGRSETKRNALVISNGAHAGVLGSSRRDRRDDRNRCWAHEGLSAKRLSG